MRILLQFDLPADAQAAARMRECLEAAAELIREDKEEQAIDPAFFIGNQADYPAWLREACGDAKVIEQLEKFGACEAGELAEYDFETWYEDLFAAETWDFRLDWNPGGGTFSFEAEDEHYGGDVAPALVLFAAGAESIRAMKRGNLV